MQVRGGKKKKKEKKTSAGLKTEEKRDYLSGIHYVAFSASSDERRLMGTCTKPEWVTSL